MQAGAREPNEKLPDAFFSLGYDRGSYPLSTIDVLRGLSDRALLGGARYSGKIQFAARNA
jgi:hypothetical protein